ncbi:hypothetical protein [Demequina muriae]|uniref:GPI inositol-deacylase PGAP1-like alpha/beta domain-containing protein n=1 Tax=Demequina muriae TaxID=3051664 RepID=A0ABT8GG97_9MICO|nr:hypothetical protein [Demequina sp. EGI L300058]MDN4480450.1 hypothetical protein [Demequina sp. EGI L300058]
MTEPPPIAVGGGAGGHAALTEDIARASGTLEHAVAEVDEAAHQLRMAAYWLERALPDAVPALRAALGSAHAGVGDALHGTGGAVSVAAEIADSAVRLAAVARAYEEAEAGARQRIGDGEWWGRAVTDLVQTAVFPARVQYGALMATSAMAMGAAAHLSGRIGDALTATGQRAGLAWTSGATSLTLSAEGAEAAAAALLPDAPPPTTGYLNGRSVGPLLRALDVPRDPVPTGYEMTAGSLAAVLGLLERIGNEPVYSGAVPRIGSTARRPAPTGVADLIAGIDPLQIGGDGVVAVETIAHPDGSRSHVVRIPGTQDFSVTAASPFDNRTNAVAVTGGDTDTARLVRDAMRAAGVLPHEPVMLVGHSQGGMVATTLAADASDEFRVTHVVTAGSPTDRIAHRDDIQYLHLSSEQEVVHQLDARATPDAPHITTVVADLRTATDAAVASAGRGLAGAHAVPSYVEAGRAADASTHASMAAWRMGAAAFVGGGIATSREFAPTFTERFGTPPSVRRPRDPRNREVSPGALPGWRS